jgi:hypothetical protein
MFGVGRSNPSPREGRSAFAIAAGVGLAILETVCVLRRRISPVCLVDAAAEAALLGGRLRTTSSSNT